MSCMWERPQRTIVFFVLFLFCFFQVLFYTYASHVVLFYTYVSHVVLFYTYASHVVLFYTYVSHVVANIPRTMSLIISSRLDSQERQITKFKKNAKFQLVK